MFEKKNIIFSESLGVCRVEEITRLAVKNELPISYYVLRSLGNTARVCYIPVEHHQVLLRDLITEDEARKLLTEQEHLKKNPLILEEVAYVLQMKKEEIIIEEEQLITA